MTVKEAPIANKGKQQGMWAYLDSAGVLEKGSDEEIKAAKRAYRKKYLLEYKRWQRANKPEFSVYFSKEKGEFSKIQRSAREHRMTIPGFLKKASLAYIDKTYIVPDREAVARIEQLLSQCFSEIQNFAKAKQVIYWSQVESMQKSIEKLEGEISESLRQPATIEELVSHLSNHDNQNKIAQKTNLQTTA